MTAETVLRTFHDYRVAAAKEFAHTMIVVDDEAWNKWPQLATPKPGLKAPKRGATAPASAPSSQEMAQIRHSLDTDALVTSAMDLGLVCSIIRPPRNKSIRAQVNEAARRADIVCLDWEIHQDSGDAATNIIVEIIKSDERRNGRLRLIAIYTGDTTNVQILEKVLEAIPRAYRDKYKVKQDGVKIESNHGLRIVCLFKAHGVQLSGPRGERQLKEDKLPKRLVEEFAHLAGGLLSNVALATIASIRNSTHHVLAKMTPAMDGPYFHHRATVDVAPDAEEYGVEVILSDLKSAVDKTDVAQRFAGPSAITARIQEIAGTATTLSLIHGKASAPQKYDVNVTDAIKLVVDGSKIGHDAINAGTKPSVKVFQKELSSLFADSQVKARTAMLEFALLTGIRAHPGSHLYKKGKKLPQLGLGTIVVTADKQYFLCLQASCDSVRLTKTAPFLFMPLIAASESPEVVVPVLGKGGKVECIGLSAPPTAYARTQSISFSPDTKSKTVSAQKVEGKRGLFFVSADGDHLRWVADLKQRRALRAAQRLGQSMGRLGFDEFEPFRQN